jgi:hypothetical protein
MSNIYQFENIYEKQVFDSWKLAIQKMNHRSVRQTYFPYKMELYEERVKQLEDTKRTVLNMYKSGTRFFNIYIVLNKYFSTEILEKIREKNNLVKDAMQKVYNGKDQDNFDINLDMLIQAENDYFNILYKYYEAAYLQKQAEDTMEAAEAILMLKKYENQKKERRMKQTEKLANRILRRSKRIQEKNSDMYQRIKKNLHSTRKFT